MSNGKPTSLTHRVLANLEAKYIRGELVRMSHDNPLYETARAAGCHVVDMAWVSEAEQRLDPQLRTTLLEKAEECARNHPAGATRGTVLHAYQDLLELAVALTPMALVLTLYPQAGPNLRVVK
ncbi:hypothetical protein [Pseudomonas sp. GL-RE-20]|uniref:hypothetical protein n=1 Tax=Pseudomonas sp. GL-RE-20 TaxID=2832372 RepID=UPI001CBFD8AC|nr:hypothetical protein [Pseudomonas sp. GL-RE-20]